VATHAYSDLSGQVVYVELSELNGRGSWSASTSYAANDYVLYGNSLYVALEPTSESPPGTTQLWSTLALVYGSAGKPSPLPPLDTLASCGTILPTDLFLVERGSQRFSANGSQLISLIRSQISEPTTLLYPYVLMECPDDSNVYRVWVRKSNGRVFLDPDQTPVD